MTLFLSTLGQIAFLFGFIIVGYILAKCKVLPQNSAAVMSKLENFIFIPALVLGTFIENFTVEKISSAWRLLLISCAVSLVVVPLAFIIARLFTKDKYIRNIYIYGLSFANFGFMGNAVVKVLFPEVFFEYLIFTLPSWILIYAWGVPRLLLADTDKKQTLRETVKTFINPMFIAMIIGMVIGLSKIYVPDFIMSLINTAGNCMSPIAMILTGVVVSSISLKKTFTDIRIYAVSLIRLLAIPVLFMVVASFIEIPSTAYICAVCFLAMPLGLNTIVIPSGLGKDTTIAAGMAVVSHLLSGLTIPLLFMFVQ